MKHVGREDRGIRAQQPLSVVLKSEQPRSEIPGEESRSRTQLSNSDDMTMIGYHDASSALTLLVLLIGASFLRLSTPSPINIPRDVVNLHRDSPPGRDEERRSIQKEEAEEEEELFKDVDPKTLAAVLLEALNHSQVEKSREGGERNGMGEEMKAEMGEVKKDREVRTMEGVDRDRDGRQELELLMAAQGKEREREGEEERKKAQEEEEKMTEKVTSRTTSQTVQVQTEQQPSSQDGGGENGQGAASQQGPISPEQGSNEEEEEQLSPEELKNLETMMKEFPRLNTATKREGDSEQNERESRGYSSYNDVIPINKGNDLVMSKKKLKWQEETQKGLNFPTFRGSNFMDDFEDNNYAGSNPAQTQLPAEQEMMEGDEPEEEEEEEEEDEEVLSPEEEEAQAKAEQEEMRRQAAEAQRSKMEEEKLADIASDMLLRYMVKQNNGNKKYSSSLSNAAEDKRSDEEQEVTEDDDIDPQTIDKLIEISNKLHLPADDVVDIISDVEKKKKKDVPPEMTSRWQRPPSPLSSSFSSTNGFSALQIPTKQNSFPVSKQPSPAVNLLKTWLEEKSQTKSQDLWSKPAKPLSANQNRWPKPQKPLSYKQDLWLKSPKPVWTGYPLYPYTYPSYYQRKQYPDYYPIYFPPPPRPKPRYYVPKTALTLKNFLGNSVDDTYSFPPKRRYHSWVQPRLRSPPSGLQQRPYYTSYQFPPLSIPKSRSPPRMSVIPPQQKFYYSLAAPAVARNEDYYVAGKQPDSSNHDKLEKYIQQILMKRPILD
ncbi:neurosecretory protein VGF [Cottoperca gobio]|uniref:Neurosecretory protein VGF n=1 Tax=Cottoperca gobio TaxID=56716 RepID=A0A6J2RP27_COTGO|nr:neurosecretory protein VGF-like [Cottoperca gobio]